MNGLPKSLKKSIIPSVPNSPYNFGCKLSLYVKDEKTQVEFAKTKADTTFRKNV